MSDLENSRRKDAEQTIKDLEWLDAFQDELNVLSPGASDHRKWRTISYEKTGENYRSGICLSGGGIRSAILCLGMLEALSLKGILGKIDYLSSVSGGGYTGAALSYWSSPDLAGRIKGDRPFPPEPMSEADPSSDFVDRIAEITGQKNTPYQLREKLARAINERKTTGAQRSGVAAAASQRDAPKNMRRYREHLRRHVNYLMPGGVRDAFSGAYVVVRAILLNLAIWLTLGTVLIGLLRWIGDTASDSVAWPESWSWAVWLCLQVPWLATLFDPSNALFAISAAVGVLLLALLLLAMIGFSVSAWGVSSGGEDGGGGLNPALSLPVAALVIVALAAGTLTYLGPLRESVDAWPSYIQVALLVVTVFLAITCAYVVLASLLAGRSSGIREKYARRRFYEQASSWLARWAFASLAFASLPIVAENLDDVAKLLKGEDAGSGSGQLIATIMTLSGVGAGVFAYVKGRLAAVLGPGSSIAVVAGAVVFIYTAAVLTYVLASELWSEPDGPPLALWTAAAFALGLGFFTNINDISLGRFYRDRLMEAFMPDPETLDFEAGVRPAKCADELKLTDLSPERPIHLVCCNVMPTGFDDAKADRRNGDSFVFSRLHCGSEITKWRRTPQVANGNLTLATAMATSGAAANPRGGFAGTGPTATTPVAFAMSLLSLRLGYWLKWTRQGVSPKVWLNAYGNHFVPGLDSMLQLIFGWSPFLSRNRFLEVTDGGHFENLGLYELIRRRCGLIIVCDGGEDPTASYAALTAALRRIEDDFGTILEFDVEVDEEAAEKSVTKMRLSGPQDIVMRKSDNEYPKDVEFARKGYFLATIRYPGAKPNDRAMANEGPDIGLLIYIKSTLIASVEQTTKGYRGANPLFPFDPTKNQFFTSEQFEAYRDVGLKVAEQMVSDTHLNTHFKDNSRPPLGELLSNFAFNIQAPLK